MNCMLALERYKKGHDLLHAHRESLTQNGFLLLTGEDADTLATTVLCCDSAGAAAEPAPKDSAALCAEMTKLREERPKLRKIPDDARFRSTLGSRLIGEMTALFDAGKFDLSDALMLKVLIYLYMSRNCSGSFFDDAGRVEKLISELPLYRLSEEPLADVTRDLKYLPKEDEYRVFLTGDDGEEVSDAWELMRKYIGAQRDNPKPRLVFSAIRAVLRGMPCGADVCPAARRA